MIKEIALRKLASDEGINPYGVGALGAGAVGISLGGFGKHLENLEYKKLLRNNEKAFAHSLILKDLAKDAAAKMAKAQASPFKRAGLLSALLGTGLGGKYLYDKLTD